MSEVDITAGEQAFNSWIYPEFLDRMSALYHSIWEKAQSKGMTKESVHRALVIGYGYDIADGFDDWFSTLDEDN